MNLADEVEHRDMLQDGNKTRTIWLNLHKFKGVCIFVFELLTAAVQVIYYSLNFYEGIGGR